MALVLVGTLAFVATLGGVKLWSSARAATRRGNLTAVISSGTAGFKRTPAGDLQRWGGGEVNVFIDDSVEHAAAGGRSAVQNGFGAWLASTGHLPALRFDTTHGARPSLEADGKSTVMVAQIPFAGHHRDLAITIGFLDPDTGRLVEADIVLNARYHWAVLGGGAAQQHGEGSDDDTDKSCTNENAGESCGGKYDVEDIATHEIGHFFGLGEDTDDRAATMFKCSSACEIHKRDLQSDDRAAIGTLYATAEPAPAGSSAGCSVAHSRAPGGAAWLVICLGVAAGGAWRRRA